MNGSRRFSDFPTMFGGPVFRPGESGYDQARAIYNGRSIDETPALIARVTDERDVLTAVRYAADTSSTLAVRSGGHGIDGTVMPHEGLVLDLSQMKRIALDPQTGVVRLGSGVLLGEMDRHLHDHGLVVPAGTASTTGVAGLTLGGGIGFNMRRFGATVDNLLACDVVTTDGRQVRASAEENADLFWALRGGGGNFGVVTTFEFQAHPYPSTVAAGFVVFDFTQADAVLAALRDYMVTAPRELGLICAVTHCPPLPGVAPEAVGQLTVLMAVVYSGPEERTESVIAALSGLGHPDAVAIQRVQWPVANSMLDAIAPYGRRAHSAGGYLSELTTAVIEVALTHAEASPQPTAPPGPSAVQEFWAAGGAFSDDFAEDSVAFSREGVRWLWEAATFWDEAADDQLFVSWTDGVRADMAAQLQTNCYINLSVDQGPQWRRGAWGSADKYRRLVEAKTRWDPHNMLQANKNVEPVMADSVT
jgi:hypothetical protein